MKKRTAALLTLLLACGAMAGVCGGESAEQYPSEIAGHGDDLH